MGPPLEASARTSLAGKGACNVINTALVVVRSFLLSVLVARVLGPSLQGVYAVLLYVVQVGVQIVTLGFPSTVVRFVARHHAVSDCAGARAVIGYVIRRELLLGALSTALCAALAGPLARHVAQGAPPGLFLLAALAILPDSLTLVYEAGFEGLLAYELLLRVNLALVPASLVASAVVLASGGRVAELLILKVALAVVRVCCYAIILRRRLPEEGSLPAEASRQMNAYTKSLSLIFLFDAVVWQRSEVVFLGLYCTRAAIACYDIAYQIVGTTMRVVPEKLTDILFPVLSGLEQQGAHGHITSLYERSVRLLFALTLGIAVALAAYADRLIGLVYGHDYLAAAQVIRVLCAALPVIIVARVTAYVLYAAGWQDFNVRLAGAAAIVNIGLALFLIPRSCLFGAALANSLTQSASVCVLVTYVLRRARVRLPWRHMLAALLAAGVQGAVMMGIAHVLRGIVGMLIGGIVGVLTYLVGLRVAGVVQREEWNHVAAMVARRGKESAGGRN